MARIGKLIEARHIQAGEPDGIFRFRQPTDAEYNESEAIRYRASNEAGAESKVSTMIGMIDGRIFLFDTCLVEIVGEEDEQGPIELNVGMEPEERQKALARIPRKLKDQLAFLAFDQRNQVQLKN